MLFPVTGDFESAESVVPDFHASHAFTAFTAGIDITWTKAERERDGLESEARPLCPRPAVLRAHVINLDLRWNSEIVNHDKCPLQSFPSACSCTPRTPSANRVGGIFVVRRHYAKVAIYLGD